MAIEIVTHWQTLMLLARELGQARLMGNAQEIEEAEKAHDAYRDLCLKADRMIGFDSAAAVRDPTRRGGETL